MLKFLQQLFCRHCFDWPDLHKNPGKEDTWERVSWTCWKCGKIFKSYCGLDILNHGKVKSKPKEIENV